MSGVIYLWMAGTPELAVIVFVASVMVPIGKFIALLVLLISGAARQRLGSSRAHAAVPYHRAYRPLVDARCFRGGPAGGTGALRRLRLSVEAGGGAVAFGAVVLLTMMASLSFDPRLIWDTPDKHD